MKSVTYICISFFFSAWGDRLWNFAVGLYLVKLTPGSLQLAAIYGLVLTSTAIVFSPVIGDWIDRNDRLKVVRITLVVCNSIIMFCAIVILICLFQVTTNYHLVILMQVLIIISGALANLAGQGEKISVSKDWIVVVCDEDKNMLANANAMMRRIDLSVAILAPVGVGFLMTVVSDFAGIIFICSWCVITMFAEYFLLLHVYKTDANLSKKALLNQESSPINEVDRDSSNAYQGYGTEVTDEEVGSANDTADVESINVTIRPFKKTKSNLNFFQRFKTVVSGWKVYQRQSVVLAGFSLALLYLTVLGFNAITTSYAYSQRLKAVYVSICFGLGSLLGIVGTFLFPIIRKRIGLPKTGLCGNIIQLSMLSLCVISIWLPGSPSSLVTNHHGNVINSSAVIPSGNLTLQGNRMITTLMILPSEVSTATPKQHKTYLSIAVFMAGIILSRAGLWIADLTITQLQQENVPEEERGTVGGVQYSFNCVFDLLHFVVTISLPYPRQFWILIFMSVCAVMSSFITYIVFNIRFSRQRDYEEIE